MAAACALALWAAGSGPAPVLAQAQLPTGFRDSLIVGGLSQPVGIAFLPDGRLLVVEQKTARIRLVDGNAVTAELVTVPQVRTTGNEQGLLGIAVDPGWPARPYVYVHCDDATSSTIRVTRFNVTGDLDASGNRLLAIDPASRRDVIAGLPDVAGNHNGGTVRFGLDGMLYVSLGEDAVPCAAQDTLTLRGVILRLDVSGIADGGGAAPSLASITAAGNPLAGHVDPRSRLIWTWGLRNPFRFQVDAATGHLLVADVGQSEFEEVSLLTAGGADAGWPRFEGNSLNDPGCALTGPHTPPIYAYDRTALGSASVIAAGIIRGPACPGPDPDCGFGSDYEGDAFLSDYYAGFLRRLENTGGTWVVAPAVSGQPSADDWGRGFQSVSDYAQSRTGALVYCRQFINFQPSTGQIRAIVPESAAVDVPPAVLQGVEFRAPFPSPSAGGVSFTIAIARPAHVRLEVFDGRGARVRVVEDAAWPSGERTVAWDGRDDARRRVPAGIYLARLDVAGRTVTRRVAIVP
jgi:glucose/arabinose dehydrogenase